MADDPSVPSRHEPARTRFAASDTIATVALATSCYNAGTIGMVQVSYRLWNEVGRDEFEAVHRAWWYGMGGIKPVVFPAAALAFASSLAQLRFPPRNVGINLVICNIVLQLSVYGLTALTWGPWQGRLHQTKTVGGMPDPLYRKLLGTHWLRVGLISASAAMHVGMALRSNRS